MNDKIKLDFPKDFYKKLAKILKSEKRWNDYLHDWVPLVVSLVTLTVFIWVSVIVPHKQEMDLRISINREIKIKTLKNQPELELLFIPVNVYNYGKVVVLDEYADIIFIEEDEKKFSVQGLFQNRDKLRVDSRSQEELSLNITNRSLSPYLRVKAFQELLGNVEIQIRVTVRNKTVISEPIEFSSPNVVLVE